MKATAQIIPDEFFQYNFRKHAEQESGHIETLFIQYLMVSLSLVEKRVTDQIYDRGWQNQAQVAFCLC